MTIIQMSASWWNRQPAILCFDDAGSAWITENEWTLPRRIRVHDQRLWTTLLDPDAGDRAAIFMQDDNCLYTTVDGAFELARRGVRLFRDGNELEMSA